MTDIKDYILGFLGGTLACSAQPNKAQESPEQVTPNAAVQCTVPTCESVALVLDTYITDESKLITIYENDEGGCIVSGDYSSEILERCSAYYTETLAKYRPLFDDTKGRLDVVRGMAGKNCLDDVLKEDPGACAHRAQSSEIIDQLELVKKRVKLLEGLADVTAKFEELRSAAADVQAKLDGYAKAKSDAQAISKQYGPIVAKLKEEMASWNREYRRTKNENADFQAGARQTTIDGYQKQIDGYKAAEASAKGDLKDAVEAYESAKTGFEDAFILAEVGIDRGDTQIKEWDKAVSDAKKALNEGVKKEQRKKDPWEGW